MLIRLNSLPGSACGVEEPGVVAGVEICGGPSEDDHLPGVRVIGDAVPVSAGGRGGLVDLGPCVGGVVVGPDSVAVPVGAGALEGPVAPVHDEHPVLCVVYHVVAILGQGRVRRIPQGPDHRVEVECPGVLWVAVVPAVAVAEYHDVVLRIVGDGCVAPGGGVFVKAQPGPSVVRDVVDPGVREAVVGAVPAEEEELMVDGDVDHHEVETALGPRPVLDLGPRVRGVVVGPEVVEEGVAVFVYSPAEEEDALVHRVVDHSVPEPCRWNALRRVHNGKTVARNQQK